MNEGIGEGKTRDDHSGVSNELYSDYAKGRGLRDLVAVVGEEALSASDKALLDFTKEFEEKMIRQGKQTDRSIEDSLSIAWKLFELIPVRELKKLKLKEINKYLKLKKEEAKVEA